MRFLRNIKLVIGIVLMLCGVGLILGWFFYVPAREITRAELDQFLASKSLAEPVVTPAPYTGIYRVDGKHKTGNKLEKVYITTHLDEAGVQRVHGDGPQPFFSGPNRAPARPQA